MLVSNPEKVDLVPQLPDGECKVALSEVKEILVGTYHVLRFSFTLPDGRKCSPQSFDLFDLTPNYTEEDYKRFVFKFTLISRCFGLSGPMEDSNYKNWVGQTGRIIIGTDSKGYKVVKKFLFD